MNVVTDKLNKATAAFYSGTQKRNHEIRNPKTTLICF